MKIAGIFLSLMAFISVTLSGQEIKKIITIETEIGNIVLELFHEKAPITTTNFIKYIEEGHFEGAEFYRTVTMDNQPDNDIKIEVIQGGIWDLKRPDIDPIQHETTEKTGIKHLDGTISMARSEPGSATSEFFICINDQPALDFAGLRNPDNQGFAAFGKVIKGMEVVHKIHQSACDGQNLTPRIKIIDITIAQIGIKKKER